MALALLADAWARERGGSLLALVVDHRAAPGVRQRGGGDGGAAWRASASRRRLLAIDGLARGPALAERARSARFAALERGLRRRRAFCICCSGITRGDQAETLLIRSLGGSGPAGLAGMAPLVETPTAAHAASAAGGAAGATARDAGVRRRGMDRGPLERRCGGAAAAPAPAASRPRWRRFGDRRPGRRGRRVRPAARRAGPECRCRPGRARACCGRRASPCCPDGRSRRPRSRRCCRRSPGRRFRRPTRSVVALAAAPRPATLAGVRLLPAGRLGPGLLAVREAAAMAPPVPARAGAVWDGRFRLGEPALVPPARRWARWATMRRGCAGSRRFRPPCCGPCRRSGCGATLLAVPHLLYPDRKGCEGFPLLFSPPRPAAAAPFCRFGDA